MAEQSYFEFMASNPRATKWLDMMAGISPMQRSQIMMAENRNNAFLQEREAQKRLGEIIARGDYSNEAISEMAKVNPEYAMQLRKLKQQEEEQAMRNQLLQGAASDPSGLIMGGMALGDSSLIQGGSALANMNEAQRARMQEILAAEEVQSLLGGGGRPAGQRMLPTLDETGAEPIVPDFLGNEAAGVAPEGGADIDLQAKIQANLAERKRLATSKVADRPQIKSAIEQIDEERALLESQMLRPSERRQKEKQDLEMQQMQTKALSGLRGFEQQTELVTNTIDKALQTISPFSTGYGAAVLSDIPNTEARKLRGYLDTIKANIGFDRLQQMRDNSPTGGALGNVSELENRLLQATQGALDPLQSDLLGENLKIIRETYPRVMEEKRRAYEADFGALPESKGDKAKAPKNPREMTDEELLKELGL